MAGEKEPIRHPRPRTLPMPYPGATREVFFELATRRSAFIAQASDRLRQQNGPVVDMIIQPALLATDPDRSLGWTLAYYEILARSAEKLGIIQMPFVFADLATGILAYEATETDRAEQEGSLHTYIAGGVAKRKERIAVDRKRSPELDVFWEVFDIMRDEQIEQGRREYEFDRDFDSLYTIQSLLYEQIEANRLGKKFSPRSKDPDLEKLRYELHKLINKRLRRLPQEPEDSSE